MKKKFNKKKRNFIPSSKIKKLIIIFGIIIFLSLILYYEIKNKLRFKSFIQEFSENFNYQLQFYEVNNLYRLDRNEISLIINEYLNQSIFLIPLNKIAESLHNLKWVKNVNLSTNLKNKIKIEIFEYKPIGLFSFNDQIFFFSKEGKIIDKYKKNINEDFILFFGNQSLKKANYLLKTLEKIKHSELDNIIEAYYINERRWNIKITNGILIYLSEKNIEVSLRNYIKLTKNLNDSEIDLIASIDLRNNEKAIISLK